MNASVACVLDADFPVAVLRMVGRLDLAATADVRAALRRCLAAGPSAVVVDVDGLTVAEDVALTALPAFARRAAMWPGCPVVICAPAMPTRHAIERLAVDRSVPVYPSRAEALAAVAGLPPPRRCTLRLPPSPYATVEARALVVEACREWALPALSDDGQLIVTELVSNAVLHARTGMDVSVVLGDRFLRLEVRDSNPTSPRLQPLDPESGEGGRGLLLIDAVAVGWGCAPVAGGKVVWAALRTDRPRHRRRRRPEGS